MYNIYVYVPTSHLEPVKQAMLKAGAGNYNNYDNCCWQTKGFSQFRALEFSTPFLGEKGKVHKEEEWKLEVIVDDEKIREVIDAMKKAHPYEVVAYSVIKMADF